MLNRLDSAIGFYQEALSLRAKRQEVLSSNIANADTPGYKARDFDFSAELRNAVAVRGVQPLGPTELTRTHAAHIPAKATTSGPVSLMYRVPTQPSLDGNTVDMDVERVNFAENAVRYQGTVSILSARIRSMLAALQQ